MTLYKDFNVSNIQANAKLAQLDQLQTGMAEVPDPILTGRNIMLLILLLFSHSKATDANSINFVYFVKSFGAIWGEI